MLSRARPSQLAPGFCSGQDSTELSENGHEVIQVPSFSRGKEKEKEGRSGGFWFIVLERLLAGSLCPHAGIRSRSVISE